MTEPKKPKPKPRWVAAVGCTLENGTRVEVGEPFPNPPDWIIEQGKVVKAGN